MRKQTVYCKLIFVILVWSSDAILGKYLNQYLPPVVSIAIRFLCASLCLLALLFARKEFVWPTKNEWAGLAALGVGVVGLRYPLQYIALQYTTSIHAALINSLTPVLTSALAILFLKQRLHVKQIVYIILSVSGVAVITLSERNIGNLVLNVGDLLILFGVLLWSIYNVAGNKMMRRLTPLQTTFYTCSFSLFLTIPLAYISWQNAEITQVPAGVWIGIIYIGVLGSGLGMFWWYTSIREIGAIKSSLLYNTMPLFTSIWAILLLGERITPATALGGALILSGSLLTAFSKNE